MNEQEPPPKVLEELFRAERIAPTAESSARAALRARLASTVGHAPLGHAAGALALGATGKAIAIVVIGLGIGAGTVAIVKNNRSAPIKASVTPVQVSRDTVPVAAPIAPSEPPTATAAAPSEAAPVVAPERRTSRAKAVVAADTAAVSSVLSPPATSHAQRIRDAWTAIRARDAARALELIEADHRASPDGALREERDAIEVLALIKLRPADDARAAASAFVRHYPHSVHRELVERALSSELGQKEKR